MTQLPYGMQLLLKRILKKDYAPTEWRKYHAHSASRKLKA